jgi:hypothetical protein
LDYKKFSPLKQDDLFFTGVADAGRKKCEVPESPEKNLKVYFVCKNLIKSLFRSNVVLIYKQTVQIYLSNDDFWLCPTCILWRQLPRRQLL